MIIKQHDGFHDYKTDFNDQVADFREQVREGSYSEREGRMTAVEAMVDQYIAAHGERPDSKQLERLSNALLHEELTDRNPHKILHTENPILSNYQFDRRHQDATAFKWAEEYDANGKNQSKPTPRKRSLYENHKIDEKARQ